jgi:hypothetical protein
MYRARVDLGVWGVTLPWWDVIECDGGVHVLGPQLFGLFVGSWIPNTFVTLFRIEMSEVW